MIAIRKSTINDLNYLVELLQQLWLDSAIDKAAVKHVIETGLQNRHQVYICAVDDEKVIGFCSLTIKNNLWLCANLGHVDELIVDSNYRGQGIGKMLLSEIEKEAVTNGCKRLELDSAFHRNDAHEFYNKLGFVSRAYLFTKAME